MTEQAAGTGERKIVGNFDITLNLTQTRGIKMTGYVYSDDTPKELNERIDMYQDTLDRQAVRVDIVSKEAQIAMHRINVEAIQENYDGLMRKRNSPKTLTSQERLTIANHAATLASAAKMIESLEAAIKAGKTKLAET